MQSKATTPDEYVDQLPEDRKEAIIKLRNEIKSNIPDGFEEVMSYGMIGWVVPHSLYPAGYHTDPSLPLPFMNLASQKNHIAVYHMGVYANKELLHWFTNEYAIDSKVKLNMGKSCIRFKKPEHITYELIGKLASKMTVQDCIDIYESLYKKKK